MVITSPFRGRRDSRGRLAGTFASSMVAASGAADAGRAEERRLEGDDLALPSAGVADLARAARAARGGLEKMLAEGGGAHLRSLTQATAQLLADT